MRFGPEEEDEEFQDDSFEDWHEDFDRPDEDEDD